MLWLVCLFWRSLDAASARGIQSAMICGWSKSPPLSSSFNLLTAEQKEDENTPKPVQRTASNPSIDPRSRALASNAMRGSISCNGCPCYCGLPRLLSLNTPTTGVPPLASPEAAGFDPPVGLSWATTSSALRKVCSGRSASNSAPFGLYTDVSPASAASSPASLRPAGSPTTSRRPSAAPGRSAELQRW